MMVFSSSVFLFLFLPFIFILNIIVPKKASNLVLLIASLIFYAYGEPIYILLMIGSIILNYTISKLINKAESIKHKKLILSIGIIFNVALIIVFKYLAFFISSFDWLFKLNIDIPQIRLPIGISFFTFQAISYLIDIYKSDKKENLKLLDTALYISFFPQLIAGPIVKYHDIAYQLKNRKITIDQVSNGLVRFIYGLSKKILIANVLAKSCDQIFLSNPTEFSYLIAWIGAITYTLQIYFDFSGYSDMAIGLASMFGFSLKENFNYPFIAKSMQNFWKRWHLSLTNWFREYVYFPLGGNRKGIKRTYINLFIIFLLTGIWHGANITFIVWGLLHGLFMILERMNIIKTKKQAWWQHIYTLFIVVVSFTIFRSDNLNYAFSYIKKMFSFRAINSSIALDFINPLYIFVFILSIIFSTPIYLKIKSKLAQTPLEYILTTILLILCMLSLSSNAYNPFIYFRF